MFSPFLRRCCCAWLVLVGVDAACLTNYAAEADSPAASAPAEVELFAAMERGDVDVVLIPRDSKKVTIRVANQTDRPLSIRMPQAFAGVPVLAQFLPPGGPLGGGGAPQALGMPGGGGANPLFGGVMNIPPGKVVKLKRPAVCLEHGKPEPGPRIKYRIAPLETASDDAGVRDLLTNYPFDRSNQRIAQLAAWHLANGKTWQELDALTIKHINRQVTRQFSRAEVAAAQRVVAALPSQRNGSAASESISGR
jgi:hypothetical protein